MISKLVIFSRLSAKVLNYFTVENYKALRRLLDLTEKQRFVQIDWNR